VTSRGPQPEDLLVRTRRVWRREGTAGLVRRIHNRLPRVVGDRLAFVQYLLWAHERDMAVRASAFALLARLRTTPRVEVVASVPQWSLRQRKQLLHDLGMQAYGHWRLTVIGTPEAGLGSVNLRMRTMRDPSQWPDDAGELVALIVPGTRLQPDALLQVVLTLQDDATTDLVYADSDTLGRLAFRYAPFLKPAWSPDLMLSVNLLAPFAVVRRPLLNSPAEAAEFDGGASGWDLAFRLAERAVRVAHIPRVLAHGRRRAANPGAATGAVERHLRRRGIDAHVEVLPDKSLRARWAVSRPLRVGIVIPTRDGRALLEPCVRSIRAHTATALYDLVVVDNGSDDQATLDYLHGLAREGAQIVQRPGAFNWAALNNAGARESHADLLLFLNNDVEALHAGWVEELARWAQRREVGVVGSLLLRPDGTIQHGGVALGMGGVAAHPFEHLRPGVSGPMGRASWYRNWLAVTGACQMMRREVFESLGGFDESFLALFSDVEFCVRAWRRGLRIVYTPFARLLHRHGQTRGGDIHMPPHDFLVAYEQLGDVLRSGDPFFNPGLSRWTAAPTLCGAGEPDAWAWFSRLVAILRERFDDEAARLPQPLELLGQKAAAWLRFVPPESP
jgi:GT2 family glycosyltransferase